MARPVRNHLLRLRHRLHRRKHRQPNHPRHPRLLPPRQPVTARSPHELAATCVKRASQRSPIRYLPKGKSSPPRTSTPILQPVVRVVPVMEVEQVGEEGVEEDGEEVAGVGDGGDQRDRGHGPVTAEVVRGQQEPPVNRQQVVLGQLSARSLGSRGWVVISEDQSSILVTHCTPLGPHLVKTGS